MIPDFGISDQIVTVSDVKYGFDNLRQSQLEAYAMTDMMQNEVATETSALMKGGGIAGAPPGGLSEEIKTEIDDMKKVQGENSEMLQESLENDAYSRGALSDIINVKFMLLPERDLKNVYCAMRVRYLRADQRQPGGLAKVELVRMQKIGDLDTGRLNKVKFSYKLPEGYANDEGIEMFLFTGEGAPLATNLSRNIRPLTVGELERLQTLN